MIVLDTNVLSESLKPTPDLGVRAWFSRQQPASLFTTTISQAEMLLGVLLLPQSRRRRLLDAAIADIFEREFTDRILGFDSVAAHAYASIMYERRRKGQPMSQVDAQIAAIAMSRNASVATRNTGDFAGCGVPIINPWGA
jgi:predicted nucleic acid-binding protein